MDTNLYNKLWAEKYRPSKIEDVIVDDNIKSIFTSYVKENDFPNLILHSKLSGTGKTTLAKAMVNELDLEALVINGSTDGTIDTLRNEFSTFVKTMSMKKRKKVIIIDEADKLSSAMQDGLRNFFEEYSDSVRFIMTCNHVERISNALQSRCVVHEVSSSSSDTLKKALGRVLTILKQEGRNFNPKDVARLVKEKYPDMRRILNVLQKDSENLFSDTKEFNIADVLKSVLVENFDEYQRWCSENIITKIDAENFYMKLKSFLVETKANPKTCAIMYVKIHEALYKLYFINDPQINVIAFLSDVQIKGYLK